MNESTNLANGRGFEVFSGMLYAEPFENLVTVNKNIICQLYVQALFKVVHL